MNRPCLAKRNQSPYRGSFFDDLTPRGYEHHHSRDRYTLVTGRVAQARAVVSSFRGLTWLTLQQLTY